MKLWDDFIVCVLFSLTRRVESVIFKVSRLISMPVRLIFALSTAKPEILDYDTLLSMLSRYKPAERPLPGAMREHQIKWANRVACFAKLHSTNSILEVGCGRGMAANYLSSKGFKVYAVDFRNLFDSVGRDARVRFTVGDACGYLPYSNNCFDLVFSVNSFEHFDRPQSALNEMLRVMKPGGLIYLVFGPLYYSPWGLHASRRLGMPYPQILFSEKDIQRFVIENQTEIASTYGKDSDRSKIAPPLNQYSLEQYKDIFLAHPGLKVLFYTERTNYGGLMMIAKNPGLFKARVSSFQNLIVSGIKLLGTKK